MSNDNGAAATLARLSSPIFTVSRPCEDGTCSEGTFVCCCHFAHNDLVVDVDELSFDELAHFRAHGTTDQKALIAAYYSAPAMPDLTPAEHAYLDSAA